MANLSTSSTYDNAPFYRPAWTPFLCILLYASGVEGYKLHILQFKEPIIVAFTSMCLPQNVSRPDTEMLCCDKKHGAGDVRQTCV